MYSILHMIIDVTVAPRCKNHAKSSKPSSMFSKWEEFC